MKGSINYLRKLKEICEDNNGYCKQCPLGDFEKVEDCRCPRLIAPKYYTDEKILEMVRI